MNASKGCDRWIGHVANIAIVFIVYLLPMSAVGQLSTAPSADDAADHTYFDRLIRRIEPSCIGKPARLPQYVRWFQNEMINDDRLFAFDVRAEWHDEAIRLSGFVEFEESHASLLKFFHGLGFDQVEDRIEVLPSQALGAARFGVVIAPHSLCYDRPEGVRENVTDCLLGAPVYLLKEGANGYFLGHTVEGYLGYIDGRDIRRCDAATFMQLQMGPRVRLLQDYTAENQPRLPVGARLKMLNDQGTHFVVALPTGQSASIPVAHCARIDEQPNPRVEQVIRIGRQLIGTQYVWGGKSSDGIDCSGLVQVAFAAEGVNLPRDSNQQVYLGRLTATRWYRDGMGRGDTLYFLGRHGKIVHTAIYLGDGQYLESAGGGVQISSLHSGDPNFDARRSKRFAFAKRLFE